MGSRVIIDRDDLINAVITDSPDYWNTPDVAMAVAGLQDRALTVGLDYGQEWTRIWPADQVEWENVKADGVFASHATAELPRPDQGTADMLTHLAELGAELGERAPVPPNTFVVHRHGDQVIIAEPVNRRLSRGEAVNLAAWLVAVADPSLNLFAPMLAKVFSK